VATYGITSAIMHLGHYELEKKFFSLSYYGTCGVIIVVIGLMFSVLCCISHFIRGLLGLSGASGS